MNDKLKPCPFCGGAASLNDAWPHWAYCTVCGAKVQSLKYDYEGAAEAAEKWNRRVNEARLLTLDEALSASGIVWCEFNDGQSAFVYQIDLYIGDDETAEAEVVGRGEHALLNYRDYDGVWRAWSAEPSKELRENTPWEQKQR